VGKGIDQVKLMLQDLDNDSEEDLKEVSEPILGSNARLWLIDDKLK